MTLTSEFVLQKLCLCLHCPIILWLWHTRGNQWLGNDFTLNITRNSGKSGLIHVLSTKRLKTPKWDDKSSLHTWPPPITWLHKCQTTIRWSEINSILMWSPLNIYQLLGFPLIANRLKIHEALEIVADDNKFITNMVLNRFLRIWTNMSCFCYNFFFFA